MSQKSYWLMKSEPDVFSFDDLKAEKRSWWDGVRNYVARNNMMKMQLGDVVLFYHSNAEPSGVAGLATVSALAEPDKSAFDKKSDYYDEKSKREAPRWFCVEVEYLADIPNFVSLHDIKANKALKKMALVKYGRLSVQPVTLAEFREVCKMAERGAK